MFNEGLIPMVKTTALEFQRKLGEFQHRAQREPVEITRHGRRELVLMSADHYDLLPPPRRRAPRAAEPGRGREQGKDRPTCLVAATEPAASPRFVVILPITHTPPDSDTPDGKTVGVEIPAKVRAALGLEDAPSWVIVSEHNVDEWPNAGLAPLPGRPGVFSYGFIPPGLFAQVKAKFLELY